MEEHYPDTSSKDGSESMKNGICLFFLLTCGFAIAQESPQRDAALEPISEESCAGEYCVCLLEELIALPSGYSIYEAERHEEYCSSEMDCSDPAPVYLILASGFGPDHCETTGCWYGFYEMALRKKNAGRIAALKKKVPHDYQPKYRKGYSGEIEIIHTDFVSFTANDQKRLAKVFIVKHTPPVVNEDNPVRIATYGFEVEKGPKTKPSVTVTNPRNVEQMLHGLYQVNIGGMHYGILTTDSGQGLTAVDRASQPTLATK